MKNRYPDEPSLMLRIVAKIKGRRIVALDGRSPVDGRSFVSFTMAISRPFKAPYCFEYWIANEGKCYLQSDGSIGTESTANYIDRWQYWPQPMS